MLLLDNWNEWGEGHYIAPYREYGFGYLDAVRKVFSDASRRARGPDPGGHRSGSLRHRVRVPFRGANRRARLAVETSREGGRAGRAGRLVDIRRTGGQLPTALDYSGHRLGGVPRRRAEHGGSTAMRSVCDGGSVLVPRSPALGELRKFTVECWVRTESPRSGQPLDRQPRFRRQHHQRLSAGLLDGKPCFEVPQTAWSHHLSGDEPLPPDRWVHLAATFDGKTMRLYMDGKECGTMSRPGALLPTDGRFVLGNYELDHRSYFQGLLDDVRIYRRVLSGDDIRANASRLPGEQP